MPLQIQMAMPLQIQMPVPPVYLPLTILYHLISPGKAE
jgi:hypothetical protein